MLACGRRAQPTVARQGLYNPNAIAQPLTHMVDPMTFGYGPYEGMGRDSTMMAHMAHPHQVWQGRLELPLQQSHTVKSRDPVWIHAKGRWPMSACYNKGAWSRPVNGNKARPRVLDEVREGCALAEPL